MPQLTKTYFAAVAGLSASAASIFGKLVGFVDGESYQGTFIKCFLILLMIICNTAVWTFFVKALNSSNNSLAATVISAATNYVCSALFGYLIFKEDTSILWWFGFSLVLSGLFLICRNETNETHSKKS